MSFKKSEKMIKSLKALPPQFKHANAAFQQFKELQKSHPLVSYYAGLYAFQIILDLVMARDSLTGEPLVKDKVNLANHLINVLEMEKSRLEKDPRQQAIISSKKNSREYLISHTQELYDECTMDVETGQASGKTVSQLLQTAVLFEVTRELFPYDEVYDETDQEMKKQQEEIDEEKTNEDEEKETLHDDTDKEKKETILKDGSADFVSSMTQLAHDTLQDTAIHSHITRGFKDMADDEPLSIEDKEDQVIQSMIVQKFSQITDEDLQDRIKYCRDRARDIVQAVKEGRNPQLSVDGANSQIDSRHVTDDEISKAIKEALAEPEDTSDAFSFPTLPTTKPGEQDQEDEPAPQELQEGQEEDNDVATYTAHHHDTPTSPKPIPKQLSKEDLTNYLHDGELLEAAQKCAKYAISAVNYEDVDTAIAELNKAIELLEKYRS